MQRIGVFVCWCGSNIAGTVDVERVAEAMKSVPGVVHSTTYQYMCSEVGQSRIMEAIKEHQLTGVVVCSCSPRMHENTFRKTAQRAGLNPYMVEIANIREQCSWIHKDKEVGTQKAIVLAKAAVAKVMLNTPLQADMVVLAAAIEPDPSARKLATMLTASMDTNDFFTEAHPKLRPVESPTAGVFLSGVCQGPKDIPETVAQAGAAASKVIGLLAKDHLVTNPCVAQSNELLCNGCSQCERVCPYGAISYVEKEIRGPGVREVRRVAQVNPAVCQGCGACTVTCPSGAMDLQGFSNLQIMAEVDAICK